MALKFAIQTILELTAVIAVMVGFIREDKLIGFEDRLKTKILDRKEAKRHEEKN